MRPMTWMLAFLTAGVLASPTIAGHPKSIDKVCRTVPEIKKVEKYCWEVECREICIPKVRFPWQKFQPPACGRVRVVKTYKKQTREVEEPGYKWEIEARACLACSPACEHPAAP